MLYWVKASSSTKLLVGTLGKPVSSTKTYETLSPKFL